MKSYITKYMKAELSKHVLTVDGNVHRIGIPDSNIYSAYIAEVANRLCITGDICLGANQHGIVSPLGYRFGWFAGRLAEGYLCSKFLHQEWQWEAAVEEMRWHIEEAAQEDRWDMSEGWWLKHADRLHQFIKDPGWRYDVPTQQEFYEFMSEIDPDCCEVPGEDYPRLQAGWLCSIQQRYAELAKEL